MMIYSGWGDEGEGGLHEGRAVREGAAEAYLQREDPGGWTEA